MLDGGEKGFEGTTAFGVGFTEAAITMLTHHIQDLKSLRIFDCRFLASLGFLGTPFANRPPRPPTEGPDDFPFDSGFEAAELEPLFPDELPPPLTFPMTGADLSFVSAFLSFVPFWMSERRAALPMFPLAGGFESKFVGGGGGPKIGTSLFDRIKSDFSTIAERCKPGGGGGPGIPKLSIRKEKSRELIPDQRFHKTTIKHFTVLTHRSPQYLRRFLAERLKRHMSTKINKLISFRVFEGIQIFVSLVSSFDLSPHVTFFFPDTMLRAATNRAVSRYSVARVVHLSVRRESGQSDAVKSGGTFGRRLMGLALFAGTAAVGTIGYAYKDPEFRRTIENCVPQSDKLFTLIIGPAK